MNRILFLFLPNSLVSCDVWEKHERCNKMPSFIAIVTNDDNRNVCIQDPQEKDTIKLYTILTTYEKFMKTYHNVSQCFLLQINIITLDRLH